MTLAWVLLSAMGALPFVFNGDIPSFTDALFETISGFTTTGASILPAVEPLQHGILFWRSFTHWIGGMGVLVLLLSIIKMSGGSQMNLMKAESPFPLAVNDQRSRDGDVSWNQGRNYRMDGKQTTFMLCAV